MWSLWFTTQIKSHWFLVCVSHNRYILLWYLMPLAFHVVSFVPIHSLLKSTYPSLLLPTILFKRIRNPSIQCNIYIMAKDPQILMVLPLTLVSFIVMLIEQEFVRLRYMRLVAFKRIETNIVELAINRVWGGVDKTPLLQIHDLGENTYNHTLSELWIQI